MAACALALVAPLAACNSADSTAVSPSATRTETSMAAPTATATTNPATRPPTTTTSTTPPTKTSTPTTPPPARDTVVHVKGNAVFMVGPTHAACLLNSAGVTCAPYGKPFGIPGVTCPSQGVEINAAVLNAAGEVGGHCGGDVAVVAGNGNDAWANGLGLAKDHGVPVITKHIVLVNDASAITCKVSLINSSRLYCAYQEGVINMVVKPGSVVSFQGAKPKLLESTVEAG